MQRLFDKLEESKLAFEKLHADAGDISTCLKPIEDFMEDM